MAGTGNEEYADKIYEISWNYVNRNVNHMKNAYQQYYIDHNLDLPTGHNWPYAFFRKPEVQEMIAKLREENRKHFPQMREDNIARLLDVAANGTNTEKINAVKELNNMFGFNSQNINLNGKVDSEIEINIY